MELKRILARDTRSANEKAIQLYGDDVLVISTQRVGDQTELIVAIDVDAKPAQLDTHHQVSHLVRPSASEKDEVFAEIFGFVQRQEKMAQTSNAQNEEGHVAQPITNGLIQAASHDVPASLAESAPVKTKSKRSSAPKVSSSRASTSITAPSKKPSRASKPVADKEVAELLQQELVRSREIVDLLRQEIGVLRREFNLARQVQPWESHLNLVAEVRSVLDHMIALGVPTGLRTLLADALADCASGSEVADTLRAVLDSHLSACVSDPLPKGFHALIGPSGAGKTCMAVRLAHMHSLEHGVEQQAIISFADKRPGAWSQLQAMAAAVGVEAYRAHDVDTLQVLLTELGHKTHVWIDTQADAHFHVAPAILEGETRIHFHAVAPLDASMASMQRLQASATPWMSLMLTKSDESDSLWHWLQTLSERPFPISFLSQCERTNVAAEVFEPKAWVARILSSLQLEAESAKAKSKPKSKSASRQRQGVAVQKAVHG